MIKLKQSSNLLSLFLILCIATFQVVAQTDLELKTSQRAEISTSLGDIKIELYRDKAPITVTNFLEYIKSGAFKGGRFYRVVRIDNDNGNPKIEVIQGGVNANSKSLTAIPLETTKQTGIKHLDGVLSMARGAPNTATSEFFICIGAQPSLDFGGKRNPDGQGFAAFGRVVAGMEIVKQIHQIRQAQKVDDNYVKGQILAEPVAIFDIKLK